MRLPRSKQPPQVEQGDRLAELQSVPGGWSRGYTSRESSTSKILHLVGRRHLLLPKGSVLVHPVILRFTPCGETRRHHKTPGCRAQRRGLSQYVVPVPKRCHKRDPRRTGRRVMAVTAQANTRASAENTAHIRPRNWAPAQRVCLQERSPEQGC